MNNSRRITVEESGAFVEAFELAPLVDGPLSGLTFAVKDLIDVEGKQTGGGNPTWRDTHPPAVAHAVCVDQLLRAGGRCLGKTVTDELAFSLIGENHFYGTPLNPAAPDRVPGGSSSGSASAVACGLVDFALGTDTGGSVRVPSSNCGIWGLRPSHDFISTAGVMPLSPTFDTVGILAQSADLLRQVAEVLLPGQGVPSAEKPTIHLLEDAFALMDEEILLALAQPLDQISDFCGERTNSISLAQICGDRPGGIFDTWLDTYCVLQWSEIRSCLSSWIADKHPQLGPATSRSFQLVDGLDRARTSPSIETRERLYRSLQRMLGPRDLLCLPTVPAPAPAKASGAQDRAGNYYRRALSLTSVAGIGRLPQVSMPLAQTAASPVGLSLIGAHGQDLYLVSVAQAIAREGC